MTNLGQHSNAFSDQVSRYIDASKITPMKVIGPDDRLPKKAAIQAILAALKENDRFPKFLQSSSDDEKIIDDDGRVRLGSLETRLDPWIKICKLAIRDPIGEPFAATGWFAGPKTIITAGHALFDTKWSNAWNGGAEWASSAKAMIGFADGNTLLEASSTYFRVASEWEEFIRKDGREPVRRNQIDVGCIQLLTSPWDQARSFAIASGTGSILHQNVTILGFDPAKFDGNLLVDSGKIKKEARSTLFYQIDTNVGESGAPIFLGNENDPDARICGVHTGGNQDEKINWGIRITPPVALLIEQWVAENP